MTILNQTKQAAHEVSCVAGSVLYNGAAAVSGAVPVRFSDAGYAADLKVTESISAITGVTGSTPAVAVSVLNVTGAQTAGAVGTAQNLFGHGSTPTAATASTVVNLLASDANTDVVFYVKAWDSNGTGSTTYQGVTNNWVIQTSGLASVSAATVTFTVENVPYGSYNIPA